MSNNKPVMSHDPLADLEGEAAGEVTQVPEQAPTGSESASASDCEDGVLMLESSITIADVGEYHAELSRCLEAEKAITIDGSNVDAIDGAGLQLLAAFVKELIEKGMGVNWRGASEKLILSAQHMGVSSALQIDQMDKVA